MSVNSFDWFFLFIIIIMYGVEIVNVRILNVDPA